MPHTPLSTVAVLPMSYLLTDRSTMNPLTESNDAYHHELRRDSEWPNDTASPTRKRAHQGHVDGQRATPVLPERTWRYWNFAICAGLFWLIFVVCTLCESVAS